MEKIYLASTNKVFLNNTYQYAQGLLEEEREETIDKLDKKDDFLNILQEGDFDLIIADTTIITQKDLRNRIIKNGLVCLIDSNAKELSKKEGNNHCLIFNSNEACKDELYRIHLGFQTNNDSNPPLNKTKPIHNPEKKEETKQEQSKNLDEKRERLSENQRKIIAHQEKEKQKNRKTMKLETDTETVSKTDFEMDSAISVAPPYPYEIIDTVQSRMIETKKMKLNYSTNKREKRLIELEPYVNEYLNLVSPKEFFNQIDKRKLAHIEMYDYINRNQPARYKPIGVWSPNQGIGVTSFVMNFALYIGHLKRLPISVMEGLRKEPVIYKELERIAPNKEVFPTNWHSYVEYVDARKKLEQPSADLIKSSVIDFKGVFWYPLAKNKRDYQISVIDDIPYYISVANPKEIVLVDLPNEDFKPDTIKMVKQLKELWILLDGSTGTILEYTKYIKEMEEKNPDLSIFLILLNYFPAVEEKLIRDSFDYPVLATLPDLNDEIRKNKYEHISIIENPHIEPLLRESFHNIEVHVYNGKSNKFLPSFSKGDQPIKKILAKLIGYSL